jgi:protein SCO1/2
LGTAHLKIWTTRVAALAAVALPFLLGACGAGGPTGGRTDANLKEAASRPRLAVRGMPTLPGAVAEDFSLRDQTGRVVALSAQRGRLVLLTFLYTHCPDICPLIAENLNSVLRELGPRRSQVSVLAVSVDPVRDTPAAVRRFVKEHRLLPEFRYLTGSNSELRPIWQSYNLLVESRAPETVAHSAYVLLLDRRERPRLYYTSRFDESTLVHDVRRLLDAARSPVSRPQG